MTRNIVTPPLGCQSIGGDPHPHPPHFFLQITETFYVTISLISRLPLLQIQNNCSPRGSILRRNIKH